MEDSSGVHADQVHLLDVLLGFNPANGQPKVMSRRCGDAETPNTCTMCSGNLMLKYSTVDVHVWNDVMLQNLLSIFDVRQCTCHMHKCHSTIMIDSCPHDDTATTKTVDVHAVWSITFPSTSRHVHP